MGNTDLQTMCFQCLQAGRNSGRTWWFNQALDAVTYQASSPGYGRGQITPIIGVIYHGVIQNGGSHQCAHKCEND
jgi:hypothetical protein